MSNPFTPVHESHIAYMSRVLKQIDSRDVHEFWLILSDTIDTHNACVQRIRTFSHEEAKAHWGDLAASRYNIELMRSVYAEKCHVDDVRPLPLPATL